MDEPIRRLLAEIYADDVARLSDQLGIIRPGASRPRSDPGRGAVPVGPHGTIGVLTG